MERFDDVNINQGASGPSQEGQGLVWLSTGSFVYLRGKCRKKPDSRSVL